MYLAPGPGVFLTAVLLFILRQWYSNRHLRYRCGLCLQRETPVDWASLQTPPVPSQHPFGSNVHTYCDSSLGMHPRL